MTCGEFSRRVSDYIEEELGGDKRAAMDHHAVDCPPCAQTLKDVQPLRDRLARLSRVPPSVGFDFSLRSRLLMEFAEAKRWRRKLQDVLFPSLPRTLVSGMAVALLALGVVTVLNEAPKERPVAWKIPESGSVQREAKAYSSLNGRGALKQLSQEDSYPVSRSSLQLHRTQSDSLRPEARKPVRQHKHTSGVRRVSVRF